MDHALASSQVKLTDSKSDIYFFRLKIMSSMKLLMTPITYLKHDQSHYMLGSKTDNNVCVFFFYQLFFGVNLDYGLD